MLQPFVWKGITYQVETVPGEPDMYVLTGPRGAQYGMLPCLDRQDQWTTVYWVARIRQFTNSGPFAGARFTVQGDQIVAK